MNTTHLASFFSYTLLAAVALIHCGSNDDEPAGAAGSAGTTGAAAANKVSTTGLVSGGISGSRWGLRGSESLGGGLNAFFNLENGFNVDNGSLGQGGLLFGRRAYVGLSGGFGSIQMRHSRSYSSIALTASRMRS